MVVKQFDRDKLSAAINKLSKESAIDMLEDAIDLLPPTKQLTLIKRHLDLSKLKPDPVGKGKLLAVVRAFEKDSLAGKYYSGFDVNSHNYMDTSEETEAWMSECNRLLRQCVAQSVKNPPLETRQCFDIIFGLLDHIDEGNDDVVFFADEGGSWQVGVNWDSVLPAWFKILTATAEPSEYASSVHKVLRDHVGSRNKKYLTAARNVATPEQRKALRGK